MQVLFIGRLLRVRWTLQLSSFGTKASAHTAPALDCLPWRVLYGRSLRMRMAFQG